MGLSTHSNFNVKYKTPIGYLKSKSGVAKTTSAVNVAAGLIQRGYSVLLSDLDPQANATYVTLGSEQPTYTMYDLLVRDRLLNAVIIETDTPRLSIIPSSIDLSGAEITLMSQPGGQTLLRTKLRLAAYDYIILDAPSIIGHADPELLVSSNGGADTSCTGRVCFKRPFPAGELIAKVRERLDRPGLQIGGVFVTLSDDTKVCREGDKGYKKLLVGLRHSTGNTMQ
ncbi:MAG: AAA family ATPase [Caldilineaceae bacterium]